MTELLKRASPGAPSTRALIIIGITVAGALIIAEATRRSRRCRRRGTTDTPNDFAAFVERFELLPAPQPPPPSARLPLASLTFAISDNFEVKGYVAGFGNPDWRRTHEMAGRTAAVVGLLLKGGAKCVGRTVMDELGFGVTGENIHYGTPVNNKISSQIPGGSSSGAAVAVAAELVDFALGMDTVGCVRTPASFCGILGFRPSHGAVSCIGVLSNSQSLDTVGCFSRDPLILRLVGGLLLSSPTSCRCSRRFIFADDCFQYLSIPKQKTMHVIRKSIQKLSGYQPPKNTCIGQYIASNVPSLKAFYESSTKLQEGTLALKALSKAMILLQRYEFKANHEVWFNRVKPQIGIDISARILTAVNSTIDDIKSLYKVRTELRAALKCLLKEDGILVLPTTPDIPVNFNSPKKLSSEFYLRLYTLLSIAGVSGCCQVNIPLGMHDGHTISVSLIAASGADKFLLDTVVDLYPSLQEEVSIACNMKPEQDMDGDTEASELLKEKGNAAFKRGQWNKAVKLYSDALKLNDTCATFYCNRAAAYLELGCFREAESDCNKAILLDKKNVKAYFRRATAREMLLCYKEAVQDIKHALALEPQNKAALDAEKRLKKLAS